MNRYWLHFRSMKPLNWSQLLPATKHWNWARCCWTPPEKRKLGSLAFHLRLVPALRRAVHPSSDPFLPALALPVPFLPALTLPVLFRHLRRLNYPVHHPGRNLANPEILEVPAFGHQFVFLRLRRKQNQWHLVRCLIDTPTSQLRQPDNR